MNLDSERAVALRHGPTRSVHHIGKEDDMNLRSKKSLMALGAGAAALTLGLSACSGDTSESNEIVLSRSSTCSRTSEIFSEFRFSTSTRPSRSKTIPRRARSPRVRWWLFSVSW